LQKDLPLKMKHIIICVTTDLESDQRVHRTSLALFEAGYSVLLVGRYLSSSKPLKRVYKTFRFRMIFRKSFLFYAAYNIRLFFFLLFRKFDIVVSNDLDTLPACKSVSSLFNKKLVFDSHELFTEVPELIERHRVKNFWQSLEKKLIPKIDAGITVCESIAEIYKEKYNIDFQVIRNVPIINTVYQETPPVHNRIIYQGAVNKGRGIELMIQALQYLPEMQLYIIGIGDILHNVKQLAIDLNVHNRVIFTGRLDFEKLKEITQTGIVGLSIEEDMGLNYRYALPNKLFDYIHAGIPVITSNLPEMARIINTWQVGEILYERTPQKLAELIIQVQNNRISGIYNEKLKIATQSLNWDIEKNKLLSIFAKLNQ